MNILFPTDFSKNSEVALEYAIDLVKNLKGHIKMINIYDVPQMEDTGVGSLSNFSSGPGRRLQEKVSDDMKAEVEGKLKALAAKYELNHQDYDCLGIEGNVKNEIDKLLATEAYDLVVLGFRNENSQKGVFFGGIANHLVETSVCPVIAVPPTAKYVDFKKIIYPTDLIHEDTRALSWLIKLARPHKAKIHLLHIGDDYEEYRETLVQELCDSLSYDHIDYEVVPGVGVSKVILEMTNKTKADMIAMTTHTTTLFQKIFHASASKDVLDNVDIPFIGFSDNTKFGD